MIINPWVSGTASRYDGPLNTSLAAGTAYANLSNLLGSLNPGDIVEGTAFELRAFGRFVSPGTPGNTAFVLRAAGGSGVSIFQTANFTPAANQNPGTWDLRIDGVFRSTNANVAQFMGRSVMLINGTTNPVMSPTNGPVVGTSFDPTVAQNFFLGMISVAATAGQNFTCHYATLKWLAG